MKRIKKTTIEQFNLLKSEMAVHPDAARGYTRGANRALVDAEWKGIMEKLNTIGPPYRTMTEWKKVWSDYRLRNLKILSTELTARANKVNYPTKKTNDSKTSNNFSAILYHSEDSGDDDKSCINILNIHDGSNTGESHQQDPFQDDECNSSKEQFFNSSIHSLDEVEDYYPINLNNYKSDCSPPTNVTISSSSSNDKLNYLGQTLATIEQQIRNQNIIMEHLSKITSNLSELMERHVQNLEKQNQMIERDLRTTECNNIFLRHQAARRKTHSMYKRKLMEYQDL